MSDDIFNGHSLLHRQDFQDTLRTSARDSNELLESPGRLHQLRSLDFVSDRQENGQQARVLAALDIFTSKCLPILSVRLITGKDVTEAPDRLARRYGYPEKVVSGNGTGFKSHAMTKWRASGV